MGASGVTLLITPPDGSERPEARTLSLEFPLTRGELSFICSGPVPDVSSNALEPRLLLIGSSIKAPLAFMVGQIEVVRILP